MPVPGRYLWEREGERVWVWVCARTPGSGLQQGAEPPSADWERSWPAGSVGTRLSRGCRGGWQLEPDGRAPEGCAYPRFSGPIPQLPADLRSKALGGLPGGAVLRWLGVSEGARPKKKAGAGNVVAVLGSGREREAVLSRARWGRAGFPTPLQGSRLCLWDLRKEGGEGRGGCWEDTKGQSEFAVKALPRTSQPLASARN